MSKELCSKTQKECGYLNFYIDVATLMNKYKIECVDELETALKDYQQLLERPCVLLGRTNGRTKELIDMISKNYKEIKITNLDDEKKLQALEIIKQKNVNTFLVRQCKNYIEYNKALANQGVVGARHFNLTKEQFDLLREACEKL